MASSLKEKTAHGLLWGGINNGALQLLGFLFGIVMGRLLSPEEFGMTAMIAVFALVATAIQNSGFVTTLANETAPTARDYNSVFWFNIIVGTSLYALLFAAAPLIASYYHEPRLVPLCRYAFLSVVLSSFGTAQSAFLFKNMMVKQRAKSNVTATVVSSLVGVTMAWRGFSYWSLATQTLLYILITTLMYWHYSPWRPSLRIDFEPVRRMFRTSCKLLATTLMTHINNNVLQIMLGHYFTAHDTGNYNQAYQWNFKCFSIVQGMIDSVAQPVLVSLRDANSNQLEALRKLMRFTAFLSFPLLFGFGLVSYEFIIITLTDKWTACVPLIKMLCVSGSIMPMCSLLSSLLISKGKTGTYFWYTCLLGVVQIALMLIVWHYGIHRMVMTYTALQVAWLFVWHRKARLLTGYSTAMFLKDIIPFALAAIAVMAATHVITQPIDNLFIKLTARIAIASALYYTVMRLSGAHIMKESMAFLHTIIKRKHNH